ncbi:MAG: hypothetical protein M3P01_10880 [Actinomycetota bacterium]|nr:hypothetical protein [Actinomycetota bacterium]
MASDGVRRHQIVDDERDHDLAERGHPWATVGSPRENPEGEAHPTKRTEAFETSPVNESVTVARVI